MIVALKAIGATICARSMRNCADTSFPIFKTLPSIPYHYSTTPPLQASFQAAPKKATSSGRGFLLFCIVLIFLYGCATTPSTPKRVDDICEIFRENTKWYRDAYASYKRWDVSIPIMMAIIHQESRFTADAKPPRRKCLWIFPGPRPSSVYGYAQAGKEAWAQYRKSTGNTGADRDNFRDAIDFVGWYCHMSHLKCGISKYDAYGLYLAFHEGHGGFIRRTYNKKGWLIAVAQKVNSRANTYKSQLASCEGEFKKRPCCLFWPF